MSTPTNNSAVAVLQIDEATLKKFDKYDEKLQKIATSSQRAATLLNGIFNGVKNGGSSVIAILQQISEKLGAIGTAGGAMQNASRAISSIGAAAQGAVGQIGNMNTSITQTAQLINQLSSKKNSMSNVTLGLIDTSSTQRTVTSLKQSLNDVRGTMANLIGSKLGGNITAFDIQQNGIAKYITALRSLSEEQAKLKNLTLYPNAAKNVQEINSIINLLLRLGSVFADTSTRYNTFTNTLNAQTASNNSIAAMVTKASELKAKIIECEGEFERMKATKTAYNEKGGLTTVAQSVATKKKAYEEELRLLNQTSAEALKAEEKKNTANQKAVEQAEKAAQRKAQAEEKAALRAQKAWEKIASQTSQYANQYHNQRQSELSSTFSKQNITANMALAESKSAKTLRDEVQAIDLLKQARLNLNKTDSDYAKKLQALNSAIREHETHLRQAGVQSSNLANRHRNLMDISGQLQRQLALLFSVTSIEGYIKSVAKVRGEFELQQRSLEAILQNKTQADAIFQKTIDLAVKSPFTIKQLVSYTKQLAAYRIEGDNLYDTTKRLADISAGLGVDMQRLILAYGQVKAAAYLRGCLGYDTEIVMYDGSRRKVQDVVVGDLLRGDDDKPRTVKELIRGKEQMYTVSGDGYSYRVNKNHILTLYSITKGNVVDVYVMDYIEKPSDYLGVKFCNNKYKTYPIVIKEDKVDDYFGFVIDQNKRFLIGDNVVTHNTEVRQFTEAGVNMYGELQSYFQEVKGEAYTTAQIVDMISKRKVTFEDVASVMKRLTSQGGLFYNMQEIQSETLRGKIMNLKDSIDLMLNSIGEEHDGILKGVVDATTALIKNFDALLKVGMSVAACFALVRIQALLSSDAIMLAAIDVGVLGNEVPKALTAMQALKVGSKKLWMAIKTSFSKIGEFFMANKWVAAITILFTLIYKLSSAFSAMREATRENEKEYDAFKRKINDTTVEFNKLTAEADKAKLGGAIGFDFDKNFEKQKQQLSALYKEMEEKHVKIRVEIENVTQENITDVFKDAQERLVKQSKMMLDISNFIAKDDNGFFSNVDLSGFFGLFHANDSFSVQMQDMEDSANDLRSYSGEVTEALDVIGAHYTELSATAKEAYNSIKDGAKEGEPEAIYIERVRDALADIEHENAGKDWTPSLATGFNLFTWRSSEFSEDYRKATYEVEALLDDMIEKNKKKIEGMSDKEKISFIDAVAEKQKFTELQTYLLKQVASKKMGFQLEIDKEDVEIQIDWVKKNIKDSLEGQKIHIDLDFNNKFLSGFYEVFDDAEKLLKDSDKYERFFSAVSKGTGIVTWGSMKNDNSFAKWYKEKKANNAYQIDFGSSPFNNTPNTQIDDSTRISGEELREYWNERKSEAQATLAAYNQEDTKRNDKRKKEAAKAERDIWNERIAVLKEMQQKYEEVRQYATEEESINYTRAAYSSSLADVKMGQVIKIEDIIPTKEGLIESLKKVLNAMPTVGDYLKKRIDLKNTIGDLELDIKNEKAKEKLEEIKKGVDDLFTGLDLYKKLKDAGLGDALIKDMFPDISVNFDEVEAGINQLYGDVSKLGKEGTKQYNDDVKKLLNKRIEDEKSTLIKLVENYKNKVSELAQIDAWYQEERMQINTNKQATPSLKIEMNRNLDTQFNKKKNNALWKEFKDSASYSTLFGDLENMSTASLDYLETQLETLRNSLSQLDPTNLKEIMNATEKIKDIKSERSPLRALIEDYKKIKKLKAQGLDEDTIVAMMAGNDSENIQLENEISSINQIISLKRAGLTVDNAGVDLTQYQKDLYDKSLEELQQIINDKNLIVEANKEENKNLTQQKELYNRVRKGVKNTKQAVSEVLNAAKSCISASLELGDALGLDEGQEALANVYAMILEGIINVALYALAWEMAGLEMKSALGIIGYILIALEAVINIFIALFRAHDAALEQEIEKLQEETDILADNFDRLKESMDNAWDIDKLKVYKEEAQKATRAQIANYEEMIKLEKEKKKTDDDKIKDYEDEIKDLQEQLQETEEDLLEEAGGFGSDENYQDAAQEFADAWVDAFNEGEDALEALNDKWDEYVANLIKKQVMLRIVGKAIEPLLNMIDEYVGEESLGGIAVVEEELASIQALAGTIFPSLNESLKETMQVLGYTASGTDDNLDALQQGIESVSETTAEALESLLNSIRFFLAMQQGDVAIIRELLESRYGNSVSNNVATDTSKDTLQSSQNSNPMLIELKSQTGYLKKLSDNIDGCFAYNNSSKGKGIRVYVQ